MKNFEALNKFADTVKEGIDTASLEYKALKDFCGQTIKVDGFYFNTKGKYGKQVVVVGNGYNINMPKRSVEDFESIAEDRDMLKSVLAGHLALTNIRMKDTENGTTAIYEYKTI